jgi:cation diffusion facilitator CzcD-associated flavoprotein CzcO
MAAVHHPQVMIIGAGPAGLAATLALKRRTPPITPTVVDPSGTWLSVWDRQFACQDITVLRSPAVHHPHPDPYRLLATSNMKNGEDLISTAGTYLPTSSRFRRFITETVTEAELEDSVSTGHVAQIVLTENGAGRVVFANGDTCTPKRIVMATNFRQPVMPPAVNRNPHDPRIRHATNIDVRNVTAGQRIVIIGQGLSAAHLALGAARRDAHVTLITRRRFSVRNFDVHPTWLGPKKLRPFSLETDLDRKERTIVNARGGGSIPHRIDKQLHECQYAKNLTVLHRVTLEEVNTSGETLTVRLNTNDTFTADELWLATGGVCDVRNDPLCQALTTQAPTTIINGLPALTDDLRWPGTNVHLMGFASALQIGPSAGNLVGHRRAAKLIAESIT